MPPLRPGQWLTHAPVAALPWLAALFIQKPAEEAIGRGFTLAGVEAILAQHWFWLAVALGIGLWAGWYTATDRAHYQPPPADAEGAHES